MELILQSQKNQITKVLQESGLFNNSFTRESSLKKYTIRYKDLFFSFNFRESEGDFLIDYTKFLNRIEIKGHPSTTGYNFLTALEFFGTWLSKYVRKCIEEENTPDLWNSLGKQFTAFQLPAPLSLPDINIKPEETETISKSIERVAENIEAANFQKPLQEQLNVLANDLKEMKQDLKKSSVKAIYYRLLGWAFRIYNFVSQNYPEALTQAKNWIRDLLDYFRQFLS